MFDFLDEATKKSVTFCISPSVGVDDLFFTRPEKDLIEIYVNWPELPWPTKKKKKTPMEYTCSNLRALQQILQS